MISGIGIKITIIILSLAPIIGTAISIAWAPETRGLSLAEASKGNLGKR